MPTTRRMLSGVASALCMARRIQAGLAANSNPSSTNRMPKPMRKSANAMDLIGLEPPAPCSLLAFFVGQAKFLLRLSRDDAARGAAYGFGAFSAAEVAGVDDADPLPGDELPEG